MPKKISIHIKESLSELESMKRKASSRLIEDRLRALILIKQGKQFYQLRLARKLGYTEKTVREWLKIYEQEGLSVYTTTKRGGKAPSVVSPEAHNFLLAILSDPHSTVTSYVELWHILKRECQLEASCQTFYNYCRRKFGSKLKVARKSHYKKDPQAVEAFKKTSQCSQGDKTKY